MKVFGEISRMNALLAFNNGAKTAMAGKVVVKMSHPYKEWITNTH